MARTEQAPASIKESLILNIRRNQAIMRDEIAFNTKKVAECDNLVKLLEDDKDGTVAKFIEISNFLNSQYNGSQLPSAQQ